MGIASPIATSKGVIGLHAIKNITSKGISLCYSEAVNNVTARPCDSDEFIKLCMADNALTARKSFVCEHIDPVALWKIYRTFGFALSVYRGKQKVGSVHVLVFKGLTYFIVRKIEKHRTHDRGTCL